MSEKGGCVLVNFKEIKYIERMSYAHEAHIQHIGKLTERNAVIKNTFIKFFMI